MRDETITYPPLDRPKPVAAGLWIVDSGPISAFGIRLPVRITVVQLADGGLLLHSPTRFDFALKDELEEHGPIRHLVAPDSAHWTYLQGWQRQSPGVLTWAAPGLRDRLPVKRSGVRLDRDLVAGAEDWPAELELVLVPGVGGFAETDLFHRPSWTLILTDLVQNLEPHKLPPAVRPMAWAAGITAPNGRAPAHLRAAVRMKGEAARRAGRRLVAFEPERAIFSHGAWFEHDAAARLRRSLSWLIGGKG